MNSGDTPELEVALRFDGVAPASSSRGASDPREADPDARTEGADVAVETTAEPPSALLPVPRATRPPSPAAATAAGLLMEAAGLTASVPISVTVTTQDGRWWTLNGQDPVVIGRDPASAQIVISDPSVSRAHCRVRMADVTTPVLEDLASANGTWIHRGDRRIDCDAGCTIPLEPGDWIRCGPHVALAYVSVEERAATGSAGASADTDAGAPR